MHPVPSAGAFACNRSIAFRMRVPRLGAGESNYEHQCG
jgi:hypothetical protein